MRIHSPADAARVIKTQRLRRNLTQHRVAEAVGITRQSYARVEQAHGGASFATYLKIFEFLGIALDGRTAPPEQEKSLSEKGQVTAPRDVARGLGQEAARSALERLRSSGVFARAIDEATEVEDG